MKDSYPKIGLARLCRLLGITRQAYYQQSWHREAVSIEEQLVLGQVAQIRKYHRIMGGRKLYECLAPFLLEHQIKMGRDALFDLLSAHHLLVKRKRKRVYTTHSFHWLHKYPNLIKDFVPTKPNQLWVSDITYLRISGGFLYISLVTDAYSRQIVGYHIAESLAGVETYKALKMAINNEKPAPRQLFHHSDRGVQYCSEEYVKLLTHHHIHISMTEDGDPLENPIAERINGILKEEYMDHYRISNSTEAKKYLKLAVHLYNRERPHLSLGMLKPAEVHQYHLSFKPVWKKKSKLPQKL
jgi:transposase InsO family protein